MTVTVTHLTSGFDTDGTAVATTASVSPSGPVLIGVFTNDVSNPFALPSLSGLGLTWQQVGDSPDFGNYQLSLWLGVGTPTSGAVTITFAVPMNNIAWSAVDLAGVDPAVPVAQSNVNSGTGITSLAVSLAPVDDGNATVGWFGINVQENITPGTGYTELGEVQGTGPVLTVASQWRPDGQATVDASWLTSHGGVGIGVELQAAASPMPDVTVEIAFDSTPDDPAPVWTDVSDYVEAATPTTISRGRPDELSEIQPSRLTVTLDNTDGRFTPGNTTSPYYPNVKKNRRIRVTAAPAGGTVRHRITGYIDEWPVVWPDGTDEYATVTISASSRRARLALGAQLPSIVETEYLLDGPRFYYPMGEPQPMAGSPGKAGDVSGDGQPSLGATGSGFITWQGATGPGTDDLSAPVFADNGRFLLLAGHPLYGPSDLSVTVEAFVNTSASGSIDIAVSWFAGDFFNDLGINSSGQVRASTGLISTAGGGVFLTSPSPINDGGTHHIALRQTYVAGALTGTLFVDGAEVDSEAAILEPTAFANHTRLVVGMYAEPGDPIGGSGWVGSVSHVAIFAGLTELSNARIADHAESGLSGFEGDSSDARIERLATYAGVPAGQVVTEPGLSTSLGVQRTDGQSPLALMQQVADTEGGVLFDAPDGDLTFHSRDHRYSTAAVLTLDAGLQQIEQAIEPRQDGQQMVNDLTVTGATGLTLRVTNQDSITEHGIHRDQVELLTTSDAELLDAATWRINRYGEPDVRIHSVAVDVVNSPPDLLPLLLDAEIGDRITLANLPAQAPAASMDGFIEGINESIGSNSYTITFELSPVSQTDAWQLDSASYSQLDETTVLAY